MKRFTGEGDAPAALDTILYGDLPELRAREAAEDNRIVDWVRLQRRKGVRRPLHLYDRDRHADRSQRLAPALAHFFNHQTHHRGQCHMILTVLGRPSLQLDLIYFQRTEEGGPSA